MEDHEPEVRRPSDGRGLVQGLVSLTAGDVVARALSFLAIVYLARVLGVESYGTLEFALSVLLYLALFADGGLELWATREAARTRRMASLTATVVALRLSLSLVALTGLILGSGLLPDFPQLRLVLFVLGGGLVVQAFDLKWVFLGRERMRTVVRATVAGRLFFAGTVVLFVRGPEALGLVAVLHVAGDAAAALYFGLRYLREREEGRPDLSLERAKSVFREALPLGASQALGLLSYNFDSLFLGFLVGAGSVGLYNAAYKPVVALLAIPLTYFSGLFPSLSRMHGEDPAVFRDLAADSVKASAAAAVPIGVGGAFLAEPVVLFLFGAPYEGAAPILKVLVWSAVLVILRGTYRRALEAADRAGIHLKCAAVATFLNLGMNLGLIPIFGLMGAAWATVVAETAWLALLLWSTRHLLAGLRFWALLVRPLVAGSGMGCVLLVDLPLHWTAHGLIGLLTYAGLLFLAGWRPPRFAYRTQ